MSEIDINSRLEELKYYEKITRNLCLKFEHLVNSCKSSTSQGSGKVLKTLSLSDKGNTETETTCSECLSYYNFKSNSSHQPSQPNESTSEPICETCLSKSDSNVCYSPIWLLTRSEKLQLYENAISEGGHLTEPEMAISFNDEQASTSSNNDKRTFAEITKYKRDIKRKRMKYRTTKAPPLTYTEELRSLISLQMELWEDFVERPKNVKR